MSILKAPVTILAAVLMVTLPAAAPTQGKPFTVYLALWRGCEAACKGFKDTLANSGLNVVFIERDAGHDKTKLPSFVEEARDLKPDLVLTWGTTVTLSVAGPLADAANPRYLSDLPVLFMIVADAVGSGIIRSFERTGRTNVTGVHNRVPEDININALRTYHSEFRKLGMLYDSGETNSVRKVDEMRALSRAMGFELVAIPFDKEANGRPSMASIPQKLQSLRDENVDFLYVGSSSFIEKNGEIFTAAALQAGIPVLSPYERLVTKGDALLSVSARYEEVGELAAGQARRILVDGISPGALPVLKVARFAFTINIDAARRLKLFPPLELLQIAETVN